MDIIQENKTEERKNPFFTSSYGTPHDTAPFDRILLEDYEPAFMEGIRQDDELTDTIIQNPEPPTFRQHHIIQRPRQPAKPGEQCVLQPAKRRNQRRNGRVGTENVTDIDGTCQ